LGAVLGGKLQAILDARIAEATNVLNHLLRHDVLVIGPVEITSTVVNTWFIMIVFFIAVFLLTRRLEERPRGVQLFLEMVIEFCYSIIDGTIGRSGRKYLPVVGALFVFIVVLNLSWFIPGMLPPTIDIMTTMALAVSTIIIVQIVGIREKGLRGYLRHFGQPIVFMAPMNIIEELVKPFSLTIRLFCNMFGEEMAVSIFFALLPLVAPVPIMALGILMGIIQAYIFSVLAASYLASATKGH